ncbi:efflux RND transporter permease subunit [Siccirubricoccus deserti]|uniref:Efflux RND transporter permease subunit n=1 Tax=Siccirubricoccus deserti TaxID=2013562 RepID=A0A9X0UE47_9PROT|nr:efflux RND transporter permease subunit [Siccirubricoccus deserti]MBC4017187.1 efflux RND transporter permease subunit [Siccirubricoccus deserti]
MISAPAPATSGHAAGAHAADLAADVIISGAISRTLSPMLRSCLSTARQSVVLRCVERVFGSAPCTYAAVLRPLLHHHWLLVPVILDFGGSGCLATQRITAEFAPVEDPCYIFARFQGPPAASFEKKTEQAQAIAAVSTPCPSAGLPRSWSARRRATRASRFSSWRYGMRDSAT